MKYDVAIVGAGLAGLVAACELIDAKKRVLLVDQEPENSMGGQAFWSFGGIFLVNSPEQKRLGIKDSKELAWQDWLGTAGFDRLQDEDAWAYKWARAYVDFAAGEKYAWLKSFGIKFFPVVGWAERGGSLAGGHGNSVPRFHIVWGTGPGIVKPFADKVKKAIKEGLVDFKPRHRVDEFIQKDDKIAGISGTILAESFAQRGEQSSRLGIGAFSYEADAVIVASGGIGANIDLVRKNWPARLGAPPKNMVCGVPAYVDGRMLEITEHVGGRIVNRDRMWHYTEGLKNWDPIWPNHGIRILPGPSSLWFDAEGNRFGTPNFPGFDTLSTLEAIQKTGYDYSWFILTEKIIEKEFALSGSEQNPDLTNRSIPQLLKRILPGPPAPIQAFKNHGEDFVIANDLKQLVDGMNKLAGNDLLDFIKIKEQILARDREMDNKFTKDVQVNAIYGARNYIGDKVVRVAKPHKMLDTKNWPLIAVRLNILTRKTLGGLQTNLDGAVIGMDGQPMPGLFAAGEVSGFGGGGVHGYRALEGTFVGGCLFTGRQVGRYLARASHSHN
ncbi:FAD-binding dehydrogenase [Lysinibacillus sphaericus]|uniref:FAD-binding dehydrogenase n=1 Tax=Lysinibacillus sphaericus TaxID=1421 RepID=A0A2S0JWH6_LYSSH|nr:FAD-binding dehydrogenase [Lysinibacillus sphaericus]AVK95497.1 FAD-binding dehydrogenase [Lysinibacillus sphaericus]MED4546136.1 FAD-binding dehydrogenase [Lysinibacillus sphaericus]TKI16976.1 FAD-binding dehydrogenase [Lysinibacillus sphaericus]SUV18878.1 fumarate reductase/succinate dehydrogenase flavoprotein domain-containing protein [Lysinibacillus sphaericus]GEC83289.1 FAD-binding dehydrogenase [Lysinibacillus sphaericus]